MLAHCGEGYLDALPYVQARSEFFAVTEAGFCHALCNFFPFVVYVRLCVVVVHVTSPCR